MWGKLLPQFHQESSKIRNDSAVGGRARARTHTHTQCYGWDRNPSNVKIICLFWTLSRWRGWRQSGGLYSASRSHTHTLPSAVADRSLLSLHRLLPPKSTDLCQSPHQCVRKYIHAHTHTEVQKNSKILRATSKSYGPEGWYEASSILTTHSSGVACEAQS